MVRNKSGKSCFSEDGSTAILSLADALSQDWRIGRMGTTKDAPIKGASLGLSAYTTLECTAQSARAGVAKLQDT
jgi:hypothetical protein